jgi:LPXTG-motif cell wall-anchored protein
MGFTKVDGTDTTKTLPGAEFELYWDVTVGGVTTKEPVYVKPYGDPAIPGVYILDGTTGDGDDSNVVITPASGQIVIMGLAEGTYYLRETKAPDGYNKLGADVEVSVGKTAGSDEFIINGVTYTLHNAEKNIVNNTGFVLPETGGEGTFWLITIGTFMAIGFAVFLITNKKMSVYTD